MIRDYPKNGWYSPIHRETGLYLSTHVVRTRLKITRFRIFHEKMKTNSVARHTYPLDDWIFSTNLSLFLTGLTQNSKNWEIEQIIIRERSKLFWVWCDKVLSICSICYSYVSPENNKSDEFGLLPILNLGVR